MDGTMKPVGILLAIAGNVMVAIAFPRVFGNLDGGDGRDLLRYIPMLLIGFAFASLAFRYGGAWLAFCATFLAIGLGSLWSAFTTDDSFDRTFGLLFGGIFLFVALVNIAIRLVSGGVNRIVGMAKGAFALTPDMLKMAQGQLETLHAQGQLTDSQLAAAKTSLSGVAPTAPFAAIAHPEALGQLDALHAQGMITDDQLKMIKMWWGAQPAASPSPTPPADPAQGQPAPGTST
jgi:hypothetical protein